MIGSSSVTKSTRQASTVCKTDAKFSRCDFGCTGSCPQSWLGPRLSKKQWPQRYLTVKFVSHFRGQFKGNIWITLRDIYSPSGAMTIRYPPLQHGLTYIPTWISNYTHYELELELENNLFDKKYINVSTGYYKHTEYDTHCRETTLTLVKYAPLSRKPPGKYK